MTRCALAVGLRRAALLTLLALGGVVGCGAPSPLVWSTIEPSDADFAASRNQWTRRVERYHHFVSRVFAEATCFSPAFADAYARHEAARDGLDPPAAEALRQRRRSESESELRFLLAVSTHVQWWNDLERTDGAIRVSLVTPAGLQSPSSVTRLGLGDAATLVPDFPYLGPLVTAYWVVFPSAPASGQVHLRLSGPPGRVDLIWEVQ